VFGERVSEREWGRRGGEEGLRGFGSGVKIYPPHTHLRYESEER